MFLVKTEDKNVARSLFAKRGRGEHAVLGRAVATIKGLLGPDAVAHRAFVDVGANIGTTTIPAVVAYGFESAVAIEPEPENVRVLRLNIVLNDLQERVTALPVAVSNEVGQADLVVDRERGGKHWIATGRRKVKHENTVLKVETVTLDYLVAGGVLVPERTGLLWMDAEAHEGHILEGASALLARGTPLVLEWNPVFLERAGDRSKVQEAIEDNYTHFASMHRNLDPGQPKFALQAVDRLAAYAERFLDPAHASGKTDILVLRLEPDQLAGAEDLEAIVKLFPTYDDEALDDDGRNGPLSRVRRRFSRLRSP